MLDINIPQRAVHIEILQMNRRTPIRSLSYDREDFLHVHSVVKNVNDVAKFDCCVPNLLNLLVFPNIVDILCIQMLQIPPCKVSLNDSGTSGLYRLLQVHLSSRASLCHP